MNEKHGLSAAEKSSLIPLGESECGLYRAGENGVTGIYTPLDRKVEFIEMKRHTLCNVKSSMGYPALYPVCNIRVEKAPVAVLMDLDGTSVHSEAFWIYIIEKTVGNLIKKPGFSLCDEDLPFVSGYSVSEHLQYCLDKYAPSYTVEQARTLYHEITLREMGEILKGRGRKGAFTPAPYLKEFLLALKKNKIKVGLVTSGLYQKAMPEIVSAFRTLGLGDPLDYYDAIITAGQTISHGQAGTLGELAPKPHPWLYAECARVGLGITEQERFKVIGLEDSSAGVVSLRLAGFAAIGVAGGNITEGGTSGLCAHVASGLESALQWIL